MLIRSFASIVIVASSFVLATAQTPNEKKENVGKAPNAPSVIRVEKTQDLDFHGGVSLQFLIKELAQDMDLKVLFDPESRLENRTVKVELRNVTLKTALNSILLKEGLISEEVAPGTIMVASRVRGASIPQIGVSVSPLTEQLAEHFGVDSGVLVSSVRPDSAGSTAGLKPGDVIVGFDGKPVRGPLGLIRAIDEKKVSDFTLTIVRDRKDQTVNVHLNR